MTSVQATRSIQWDMGHRVHRHEGKCKNLHGHRYKAEVTVESVDSLDSVGRVVDFGVIKDLIGTWIDQHWDHRTMIFSEDYEMLRRLPEGHVVVVPWNPTAENIAGGIYREFHLELATRGIRLVRVRVWETPNCYADAFEPVLIQPSTPKVIVSRKHYLVNEIYKSVQGEGSRAGEESVFLRFSGCNMKCDVHEGAFSPGGFACDTEFESGNKMTRQEVVEAVREQANGCKWIVATGGEPGLQLDDSLVAALHGAGFLIQVETNGTCQIAEGVDMITVSPKVAEHAIKQLFATEVKYVRGYGQALPETRIEAARYFISPAFNGDQPDKETIQWCQELVQNSTWEVSLQEHKIAGVR